ncbi:hypothetical protein CQW39_09540 [Streptomyces griseofuscus]|uniref:hypothetical protein n=1 Tax=Streptomyces griseofuscus TaxID=146922 RepID=UPI000F6542F6|nr:hypothetical protein [Streptomyces griseofuscus]RRQ79379.1 hypothetical protein CQW39_09540 [Streptomyces griseofuscus]
MKQRDPLLAELYPTGSFGGPRPGDRRPGEPDPEGPRRGAELAAAVAEIDHEHGYGVHLRYRQADAA